jgi:esterase/lipase superfamily enzyme/HEAT repeat protein
MRRAIYFVLIVGSLAGVAGAEDAPDYRGQTAAQWLQQLSHPSPSARAAAAQAFVIIGKGNEDAVEPLIGLLADRDARVRFYAAYALGKLETRREQCIAALIKMLPDTDEHVRYNAQWSLAQIAKQIAESKDDNTFTDDGLATLLAEAETQLLVAGARPGHLKEIRAAIARCERTAPPAVALMPPVAAAVEENDDISRCLEAMASDDLYTKVKALESLRKHGPIGIQRLFAAPESAMNLERVAWHLPTVIASLGEPVVPVLVTALKHPSEEIRDLAANALIELGPTAADALPDLMGLLEDAESSEAVRQQAIWIMKNMGPAAGSATELLIRELNDVDRDESTQANATEALGAIGPHAKPAIPALIERLKNAEVAGYLRPEIASTLVCIDPKSEAVTRALVAAFEESEDIFAAIGVAEKLCECGPSASVIVPRLIEVIDETSYDTRASVLTMLGQLGTSQADEVIPLLFERLMDPQEELMVRVAAAKALGKFGPAGVHPIAGELQNGDEANQLIAARALIELASAASPANEALREMLQERLADNELRALVAVALGQLGAEAKDAAPALTELLRDPESDSYLRSMCAVALGQVDTSSKTALESTLDDAEAEVQIASAYSLCKNESGHARGLDVLLRWLESDEYRGSAIDSLIDIGEVSLPGVVEKMTDTSQSRDTRIACVEVLSSFDEAAIMPLLQALNDEVLAEDAGWALRDRGNKLIPTLLASVEDEADFPPRSRELMKSVIEDLFMGVGEGGGEETWTGGHALVRRPDPYAPRAAAMAMEIPRENAIGGPGLEVKARGALEPDTNRGSAEDVDPAQADLPPVPTGYKTVDVFYGTNRKPIEETSGATTGRARWIGMAVLGVALFVIVFLVGLYRRGARRQATAGLAVTTLALLLGLLFVMPAFVGPAIDKSGPKYGGEYSDRVEMGVCQVTIPDIHREGELEAPTLLRLQVAEDLQKHIVLRSVQRMESDEFFSGLRKELQSKGNHILVFVHGFNVSFENAARRTAQMSSDLKFTGAPICYSWPSQADWWKYRVDEKNVELSVDQLKGFLLAVAERSDADTINLVAHSMGNRVLTAALKEMDVATSERGQLFNQVILAAPDIDADIFKQRIAPAIVTKAKHVTLYASSKDLALVASRKFNSGDPRAGDAGENLVVVPGIETIDVSNGDSSLLGHSYYGDNISVLQDIEFLLQNQPASSRRFLEPMSLHDDAIYWMFQPPRVSRRSDNRSETR